MLKLFRFEGVETDWVAAQDEAAARECLRRHYGISHEDIASSYEDVAEVDPCTVEMLDDGRYYEPLDDDDAEPPTKTAADVMHGKAHPFLVGSTCE